MLEKPITVCSFLWNDPQRRRNYKFGPEHVRILRNMVQRNLSLPHRFICVTDEKIEGIETVPMDWTNHVPGTCFVKTCMWRRDAWLGGRIFYLDLDVVITGNIDHIVDRKEDVVLYHNPNYRMGERRAFYQGSVQLMDAGARPELYECFEPLDTPKWVNWRFGGAEQAWYSEALPWTEAYWDEADGIYGAGRIGDWHSGVESILPDNACIVVFPGNREPSQPEVQEKCPWVKNHYK